MPQMRLIAVLLVGLIMGTTSTTLAQATSTTTTATVSVKIVGEHPCTGEPLLIEGVVHYLIHDTSDASGGSTHINFGAFTGSGRGLASGTRYRLVNVQLDNQAHFSANGAAESTDVITIHFIALGDPQKSFYSQIRHHATINANDDVTASPFFERAECAWEPLSQ